MKQGIACNLPVIFDISLSTVSKIEFIFKQTASSRAPALKTSVYMDNGTGDATAGDVRNQVMVPWTAEDTYKFRPSEDFYMDTRVTLKDSGANVPTSIVQIEMQPTLFPESETSQDESDDDDSDSTSEEATGD